MMKDSDSSDKGGEKEKTISPSGVDEALTCIADIFKAISRQLQAEIDASRLDMKDLLGMYPLNSHEHSPLP